jgi:hypothetical protein
MQAAGNNQTQTGRNLVTLGLILALVGVAMLAFGTDAGTWVAIAGLAVAAIGGFTSRVDGGSDALEDRA